MENNSTFAFLQILTMVSFDENLFRKEFKKTLQWISKSDFLLVGNWFIQNQYHHRYPDLLELIEPA